MADSFGFPDARTSPAGPHRCKRQPVSDGFVVYVQFLGRAASLRPVTPDTREQHSYYATVVAVFCALLLISNIGAVKLIQLGPFIFDGGALLFPMTYIIDDVLAEIYGFKNSRRAIYTALVMQAVAAFAFWLVSSLPGAEGGIASDTYSAVVGFVPRIVLASLSAFAVGELLNAFVLVKIKKRTREPKLWLRLIGSTVVGELADTIVFCTVAFFGVITGGEFVNYVITGYLYKTGVEVLMLPITYRVIGWLKRNEHTYVPAL